MRFVARLMLVQFLFLAVFTVSAAAAPVLPLQELESIPTPPLPTISFGNVRGSIGLGSGLISGIGARTYDEFRARRGENARVRSWFFVEEIEEFAAQIEELYYSSVSDDLSQNDLDRRTDDLGKTIDELRNFVNFNTDPPQINIAPLPEESFAQRMQRVLTRSARLIPNVIELAVGDSVDLDLLNQVRDDLAITEALILALPQSDF